MELEYCPKSIEKEIQEYWHQNKTFKCENLNETNDKTKDSITYEKPKFYCLTMWPYPSGKLHMGHVRNYSIGDVIARFQRMKGKNVLHPMGWDAFGLPAEIAAKKHNLDPNIWTKDNIKHMKYQLKSLGLSYDWDRELTSCSSDYYKWEQWFLLKLLEKGLAYKKESPVNWCSQDNTVLANEQVIDGKCWRCDSPVKRKRLSQWFIKTTKYADQLLNDIDKLEDWPENVKKMQREWIGQSKGAKLKFPMLEEQHKYIEVFTTRPETVMGVTYIAISTEHPIAEQAARENIDIKKFIEEQGPTSEAYTATYEKKGIFSNRYVIHPISKQKIPIWIANFVLPSYGCGCVMGVPAHDIRDYEFAKKYGLEIKKVIDTKEELPYVEKKGKLINSLCFDGLECSSAAKKIVEFLSKEKLGGKSVQWRIQDWCISRQRYWGAPIPVLIDDNENIVPVPEKLLPVTLPPYNKDYNPLLEDKKWRFVEIDGKLYKRESDTFDTFMESSWYYARYTCPYYDKGMICKNSADYWLPIDIYIGGIEHAAMHLLYFRLFHKMMRDIGLVKGDEPAKALLCQGMVTADAFYYINEHQQRVWVSPLEVDIEKDNNSSEVKAYYKGRPVVHYGVCKMSKSKNNGIDPQTMVEKYGADTVRLFMLFAAPPTADLEWKESTVEGARNFLSRLWRLSIRHINNRTDKNFIVPKSEDFKKYNLNETEKNLRYCAHFTLKKVKEDVENRYSFNTAISSIMCLVNDLSKALNSTYVRSAVLEEAFSILLSILYPFTPHICFKLWDLMGYKEFYKSNIDDFRFPYVDQEALKKDTQVIAVQINGKTRGTLVVANDITEQELYNVAINHHKISKYIVGKEIKKCIFIPKRIVNWII